MKTTLAAGASRTESITIDRNRTIEFLGEDLRLYSTPSMVKDIEYCCLKLIQEHLDEGESSVGIHIATDHLGPTPLGERIKVQVTVTAVESRKVILEASVHDGVERIGQGRHIRYVIDVSRHAKRVKEKAARLASVRS